MLFKLQKNTLIPAQLIGYGLSLLVGCSILLLTTQFYVDIKPVLTQQTDVFKNTSAVISKSISVFKTLDKEKIYFTDEEIHDLAAQPFTKNISTFTSATFKIKAHSNALENTPVFYTDLFFESIPDQYLDVTPEDWHWESSQGFIPVIIPETYLNLYNFGFAESQGLPVLSKNTISQIAFTIKLSGNHKSQNYTSKIVGFSNKINSILVPETFLTWANKEFGRSEKKQTSRLLLEFNNPSDPAILDYFNQKSYAIGKDKLAYGKLVFFFKSAFIFVFAIALIIILLAIMLISLSIHLIMQRNQELLINLYSIGYGYTRIARFYQLFISIITVLSIALSLLVAEFIRHVYITKITQLFDFTKSQNYSYLLASLLALVLVAFCTTFIVRRIKNTVTPTLTK